MPPLTAKDYLITAKEQLVFLFEDIDSGFTTSAQIRMDNIKNLMTRAQTLLT